MAREMVAALPTNPNARTKMTLFMSYDECHNWPVSKVVHQGSSAYSYLTVTPDSHVLLATGLGQQFGDHLAADVSQALIAALETER